jgi:hypothetical protein
MLKLTNKNKFTPFNILNADPKGSASVNVIRQRYFSTALRVVEIFGGLILFMYDLISSINNQYHLHLPLVR